VRIDAADGAKSRAAAGAGAFAEPDHMRDRYQLMLRTLMLADSSVRIMLDRIAAMDDACR